MATELWRAQNSFVGGVVSEKMYGRLDLQQYQDSVAKMLNFKVLPQGGFVRRSGLKFVVEVKDSTRPCRVIPFEFSADDSYCIEAGDLYFRFIKEGVQVTSGGSPVEIVTPYSYYELFDLRFVQAADTMWIVHPSHQPRKLLRYSDTEWYIEPVSFVDGPYLPINATQTTLVASAPTGPVTLNAAIAAVVTNAVSGGAFGTYIIITTDIAHGLTSGDIVTLAGIVGTVEANGTWTVTRKTDTTFTIPVAFVNAYISGGSLGASLFVSSDVGRHVRIFDGSAWGWGEITAYTSASQVNALVVEGNFPTSATRTWRIGKWSNTTGWPAAVMLYQQRICYAGDPINRQDIDFSQTGKFNWFQTAADDTLLDTDALSWSLFSNSVDSIAWMQPARGGLAVGTSGGCWIMTGAGGKDDPLTPNSVNAAKHEAIGTSQKVMPASIDNAVLFVDKSEWRIHEFAYLWQDDTYRAPDLTVLADDLFIDSAVIDMDVQGTEKIVWAVIDDGRLLGLTYMRSDNVVAWHEHTTDGEVESVCAITEGEDEIPYFVVNRHLGADIVISDVSAYPVAGPFTTKDYVKITTEDPHGFTGGEQVVIEDVIGTVSANGRWNVNYIDADSFYIASFFTGYYTSGGVIKDNNRYIEFMVPDFKTLNTSDAFFVDSGITFQNDPASVTVSGLGHLEGKTVAVLADGRVVTDLTVSSGSVTLPFAASGGCAGLNFFSDVETLPIELSNDRSGSTVGRQKDIGKTVLMVTRSYGAKIGRTFDSLAEMIFNESLIMGTPATLFSGKKNIDKLEGHPSSDVRVCIRQDIPMPLSVTSLVSVLLVTED